MSIVVFFADSQLVDNGDFWRVTMFLHVDTGMRAHYGLSLPFHYHPIGLAPGSLFAILAWVLYEISTSLGAHTFQVWLLVALEYLVFWSGAYLASERLTTRNGRWLFACFTIVLLLTGFYVRSFYEETAVLLLCPWLVFGLLRLSRRAQIVPFAIAALLLALAKSEMVVFVPLLVVLMFFYLPTTRRRLLEIAGATLLMVGACSFTAYEAGSYGFAKVNAYDRVENGIGYALGGIGTWTTGARLTVASGGTVEPQRIPRDECGALSAQQRQLLGTAYWNTGNELRLQAVGATGSAEQRAAFQQLIDDGSWTSYAADLARCPVAGVKLVANAYLVALRTDYQLYGERPTPAAGVVPIRWLADATNLVLRFGGFLLAAALLATATLLRSRRRRVALLAACLLVPLGVVAGDGFFDFERHMFPCLMLLPVLWFVVSEQRVTSLRASVLSAPETPTREDEVTASVHDEGTTAPAT